MLQIKKARDKAGRIEVVSSLNNCNWLAGKRFVAD